MKFVWVPSTHRYRRTETEVRKEKLAYEVVDFETDKDSLIDRFNAYEERIEALEEQLRGGFSSDTPPTAEPQGPAPSREEQLDNGYDLSGTRPAPAPPPPPAPPSQLDLRLDAFDSMTGATLAPLIETAVERLAALGEEGFESLDEHMEHHGVGHGFSRGVHILACVAAGESQLTRILMRQRRVKKWG